MDEDEFMTARRHEYQQMQWMGQESETLDHFYENCHSMGDFPNEIAGVFAVVTDATARRTAFVDAIRCFCLWQASVSMAWLPRDIYHVCQSGTTYRRGISALDLRGDPAEVEEWTFGNDNENNFYHRRITENLIETGSERPLDFLMGRVGTSKLFLLKFYMAILQLRNYLAFMRGEGGEETPAFLERFVVQPAAGLDAAAHRRTNLLNGLALLNLAYVAQLYFLDRAAQYADNNLVDTIQDHVVAEIQANQGLIMRAYRHRPTQAMVAAMLERTNRGNQAMFPQLRADLLLGDQKKPDRDRDGRIIEHLQGVAERLVPVKDSRLHTHGVRAIVETSIEAGKLFANAPLQAVNEFGLPLPLLLNPRD